MSSDEDSEEWRPTELKSKGPSKIVSTPAAGDRKATAKRTSKPKQPKALKTPKAPKVPKDPKSRVLLKHDAERKKKALSARKDSGESWLAGTKRERDGRKDDKAGEHKEEKETDCPKGGRAEESGYNHRPKKEEIEEEDFMFEEPYLKKQKTSGTCQGQPTALPPSEAQALRNELNMTWDLTELLSTLTCVEMWVCVNIIVLLREENTVPFMVRYRKEMINHMDADAVRDVQLTYEELCNLAKKTQSVIQTLKKDGVLTVELEQNLRSCRSADELDHVYSPYKKGSKLTKARRAKALGLEVAASALLDTPHTLDLMAWVKPDTKGLSSFEEVATGVEHILADMIAKDPETLTYVKSLCENSFLTIRSSVSKKQGAQQNKHMDKDKFHLYFDFTCNIQRIQPHQTLAINRGESLKILTVKVNICDRVKSDFIRWCINNRWRPKTFPREELNVIIRNAVEDSYKRLILPFLTRSYRTKLTFAAEKESIAMFVRNLRQRLLMCPVRGCIIMGVDPGFRHGCKLAILSPTSQILHTDVVYLHNSSQPKEAEKLRHLMIKYCCTRVVIGNGTACRETESFFTDLIFRRYFHPLEVSYCITNEAGASIYSVSPEAVKEMPDLDPNLRSAVSIGRRVQDPLAELVKIDPKHIGIGTYQHDVSAGALKAALDGVVQECVSFVGVDINICSETLMSAKSSPHPVAAVPEKPAAKKGKGKTCVNKPTSFNPLDQTCIHPESYHVAQRFMSLVGGSVDQIGNSGLQQCVESKVRTSSVEELAGTVDTTPETLKLIIDGLTQPPGFDIRQNFGHADFKRGIVSMSDLRVGTVLTGRVDNAALFGAFVDIGVGRSGLIHKSNITLDKLPVSQRNRSLALGPGERVEVRVLNVDPQRGRIGLDLIRVLE
uniref:S1 RNA binding domain 1 n=1 Tax=Scophthalmus maximus TaxID=52904 RepID=A0A8D3BV28_SCOMX